MNYRIFTIMLQYNFNGLNLPNQSNNKVKTA